MVAANIVTHHADADRRRRVRRPATSATAEGDARGARGARRWRPTTARTRRWSSSRCMIGNPAASPTARWRAFARALLCWSAGGALPRARGSPFAPSARRASCCSAVGGAGAWLANSANCRPHRRRRALGGLDERRGRPRRRVPPHRADGGPPPIERASRGADGARSFASTSRRSGASCCPSPSPASSAAATARRARPELAVAPAAAAAALFGAAAVGARRHEARGSPSSPPPRVARRRPPPPPPPTPPPPPPASSAARPMTPRAARASGSAIGELSRHDDGRARRRPLGAPFTSPVVGASPSMGVRAAQRRRRVSPAYAHPTMRPSGRRPRRRRRAPPAAAARCRAAPTVPAAGRGRASRARGRWWSSSRLAKRAPAACRGATCSAVGSRRAPPPLYCSLPPTRGTRGYPSARAGRAAADDVIFLPSSCACVGLARSTAASAWRDRATAHVDAAPSAAPCTDCAPAL